MKNTVQINPNYDLPIYLSHPDGIYHKNGCKIYMEIMKGKKLLFSLTVIGQFVYLSSRVLLF